MKFTSITIKNFRNFENISELLLNNRNIFFGMNDVGKSNFLAAIRFVFDYSFRKNGFQQTDFYNLDSENKTIEIVVKLDISEDNKFSNMLRAKAKGSVSSSTSEFYIKVNSVYNGDLKQHLCELRWGSEIEDLDLINPNNSFSDLDRLFDLVYIGSSIDIEILFKKHFTTLVKKSKDDLEDIKEAANTLKLKYKELQSVKSIEMALDTEYKKFAKNGFKLTLVPTDINIDPYKNIVPMLSKGEEFKDYPLSGDGQRKISAYALTRLISLQTKNKIHLFLIEEPENHLHRTSLFKLSLSIFNEKEYPYLFVTTHSSELLSEMDNVNLIRIFGNPVVAKSCFYKVPEDYVRLKNILNSNLASALFYNKVLLVEGPSELILFDHLLKTKHPEYKSDGGIILPVNGTGFENYIRILSTIGISVIIKTDNDLRKKKDSNSFELLGLNRIKKILQIYQSMGIKTDLNIVFNEDIKAIDPNAVREEIYANNFDNITTIGNELKIFMSKIDLENDLNEVISAEMKNYLNTDNAVEYLQKNKMKNMAELVTFLQESDLTKIVEHSNFKCVKELINYEEV